MGSGFIIRCKSCDYRFEANLGIGMMFPWLYEQTISDIKEGKFGEEYRLFFDEHNGAAVNCEIKAAICTKCGNLETVKDMSLYLLKDGIIADQGSNYVMPDILEDDYDRIKSYEHKCSLCSSFLRMVDLEKELRDNGLQCPECGGELEESDEFVYWD